MPDNPYMIIPTVSIQAPDRHDNPRLLNVRTGQHCRWQDLPGNNNVPPDDPPPQRIERIATPRNIIPVELLVSGDACKVKCDNRWHQGRVWFLSKLSPRIWVVVYPYRTSLDPDPFPLLVDLDEELVGPPGKGASTPDPMPEWAK